jgi:uncharacterized membrane protein HdeD (DUF308 family)
MLVLANLARNWWVFALRGITALALLLVVAYWSIFRGILEIIAAVRLRDLIQLVGIYAVIFGIAQLMLGFRLKGLGDEVAAPTPARAR